MAKEIEPHTREVRQLELSLKTKIDKERSIEGKFPSPMIEKLNQEQLGRRYFKGRYICEQL